MARGPAGGRATFRRSAIWCCCFTYLGREQSEPVEQAARAIRARPAAGRRLVARAGRPDRSPGQRPGLFRLEARRRRRQPTGHEPCAGRRSASAAVPTRPTSATRLWLALLGQIDYDCCPPIAPEWLLTAPCTGSLPATDERRLAALSVVWSLRPRREVELARGVRELFIESPRDWPARATA